MGILPIDPARKNQLSVAEKSYQRSTDRCALQIRWFLEVFLTKTKENSQKHDFLNQICLKIQKMHLFFLKILKVIFCGRYFFFLTMEKSDTFSKNRKLTKRTKWVTSKTSDETLKPAFDFRLQRGFSKKTGLRWRSNGYGNKVTAKTSKVTAKTSKFSDPEKNLENTIF